MLLNKQSGRLGLFAIALFVLLTLAPGGCALAGAVQRVAEPIDRAGCKVDCELADMTFSRYLYHSHSCWCWDAGRVERKLY